VRYAVVAMLMFAGSAAAQSPAGWSYYGLANGPYITNAVGAKTVPYRHWHADNIPVYGPVAAMEIRNSHGDKARPALGWLGLYRPSPRARSADLQLAPRS
jgi:hypothetical protein